MLSSPNRRGLRPGQRERRVLRQLLYAGVTIVRINSSHGSLSEHVANIVLVRQGAARAGVLVGVLVDRQQRKIQVGDPTERSGSSPVSTSCCAPTPARAPTGRVPAVRRRPDGRGMTIRRR